MSTAPSPLVRSVWPRYCGAAVRAGLFAALALGCGSENLVPPRPEPTELYWDLELNHGAVLLSTTAPYDTLQLVATPRNYRAEALGGLPAAVYESTDPDKVLVTSDGQLVAVKPTAQPVAVIATLMSENLKHADTVMVMVVEDPAPPVMASLSIHPVPPDSAKVPTYNGDGFEQPSDTIPARAVTAGGELIPIYGRDPGGVLPVDFRSADTSIARMRRVENGAVVGEIVGMKPGEVQVYGRTTAFGMPKADTVVYRVGWAVLGVAWIDGDGTGEWRPRGPELRIGVGGAVIWAFGAGLTALDTIDIAFADAALPNVGAIRPVIDQIKTYGPAAGFYCFYDCDRGGNFVLTSSQSAIARHFPVAGTYEYHSAREGFSGRIVVVDER